MVSVEEIKTEENIDSLKEDERKGEEKDVGALYEEALSLIHI